MILTEEQKANISVLVSNEVNYQETYQEVYDHMLTTLEAKDSLPDLQKSYAEILEEDFGGHQGIEKLEGRQSLLISAIMKQRRYGFFTSFFKFPGIIIPFIYVAFCYYGLKFYAQAFVLGLLLGAIVLIFLPSLLMAIGNLIIKYSKREAKTSIKSISSNVIARGIGRFFIYSSVIGGIIDLVHPGHFFKLDHVTSMLISDIMICTAFLIICIYNIVLLKIYRIEFKSRLAL